MKKILSLILAVAAVLSLSSCQSSVKVRKNKNFTIVASCYPVYVMVRNLTDGIDGIDVYNMTETVGGCLHDYTLTSDDMKKLADCDMFIISGAGMEPFVDEVKSALPKLSVKDASVGVRLIGSNEHYWLDPANVLSASRNIKDYVQAVLPGSTSAVAENYNKFAATLSKLKKKPKLDGLNALIFHEGFEYILNGTGAEVVAVVDADSGTEPGAKDIAALEKICREKRVNGIFVEKENNAAKIISRETGIEIYTLDPLTGGDDTLFGFTEAMQANYAVLSNIRIVTEEGTTAEEGTTNALS